MKFIDRQRELEKLEHYHKLSRQKLITIAISGLRRVGKTTLIKEFIKNKRSLYFFVYDSKTSADLLQEFSDELRSKNIVTELETIPTWSIFFRILFERCEHNVIVFDEFQNFFEIERSVFSILQRHCDEHPSTPLTIIILGSIISLFKNIFEDKKQPLFGRIAAQIRLEPFTLLHSLETLRGLGYSDVEEMLRIYGVFGGFPKYYAAIEQFGLEGKKIFEIIDYLFIQENAPLETEVTTILKQEFGRRSSLYYSILHSIAKGKNKLSEIANDVHMKESSITRHLSELEKKFSLIQSLHPVHSQKNRRYSIIHPLISFWFTYIYDKFSHYSLNDTRQINKDIKEQFNTYFGRRFEIICKNYITQLNEENALPFQLDYLSTWWGSSRENDERKNIEIDLIGINNKTNSILFVECKWKDKVDPHTLLRELKEKSRFVPWRTKKRTEYYCLIAKSFTKKTEEKNVLLLELEHIRKSLPK